MAAGVVHPQARRRMWLRAPGGVPTVDAPHVDEAFSRPCTPSSERPSPPDRSARPAGRCRGRPGDTVETVAERHAVSSTDLVTSDSPAVAAAVERWSTHVGLPTALLAAVTWHESRWRPDARSEKEAIGVGQLLPSTAAWVADTFVGEDLDPRLIDDNVRPPG
jgi:hypothetical protein